MKKLKKCLVAIFLKKSKNLKKGQLCHQGTCKPNIKNPFYQILVNILKILHAENEENLVENKQMARSDVLAKLSELKNGQVQAITLKTR
jgi:hypothetical protein